MQSFYFELKRNDRIQVTLSGVGLAAVNEVRVTTDGAPCGPSAVLSLHELSAATSSGAGPVP